MTVPSATGLNPASALYWLPPLTTPTILRYIPKTVVVPLPDCAMSVALDGRGPPPKEWATLVAAVDRVARHIGGPPAFLRSDLISAKFDGPGVYRLDGQNTVEVVAGTLEANAMRWCEPSWLLVREWLDLRTLFPAFGGHPIAREWRYFTGSHGVECRHFYWPEGAIRFYRMAGTEEPDGWQETLRRAAMEEPPRALDWVAMEAVRLIAGREGNPPEAWSVDFAEDVRGRWWLIDMAPAEKSSIRGTAAHGPTTSLGPRSERGWHERGPR